jgi:argininosuccinate lyase
MQNKTWGGRFKKSLHPIAKQFNASLSVDHILFAYDIQGSIAHANMLAAEGIISVDESSIISHALLEIQQEIEQGQHALDDGYEDVHMFIEQLLINKIGEAGKKLHTGRSRNDQVALDLRLYTRGSVSTIVLLLKTVVATLQTLSLKHATDFMPGYTHLQQAQPISLGRVLDAYCQMFTRDISRMEQSRERMNYSPLGAGALAGSSLPLNRQMVADALQFNGVIDNSLDAVSDRDFIIEFCSAASICMVHLSRLSEDFILWSTQEFGFIQLDDAFSTGSSLMPNKKNPDILELIRGKSGRVFGNLMAILTVMKGLPLAYNKDMQEDKVALFDTVDTLTACLTILPLFLESIHFNTEWMHQKSQEGYLHATHLVETLVMKGMPFRDAHHQVGQWVAESMDRGCTLDDVMKTNKAL